MSTSIHFSFTIEMDSSLILNSAFPCGLHGFQGLETLSWVTPVVVGHLPREILRFTRFIILHGAAVKVKVTGTEYRRFPLIQGGLEIPVEVEVQMENSSENVQALSKCKTLIDEN